MTQLAKLDALIAAATNARSDAARGDLFVSRAGHALVNAAHDLFEVDGLYTLASDVEHEHRSAGRVRVSRQELTEDWAPAASRHRVLALRAEPPAASHRFALRPAGAACTSFERNPK